MKYYELTCLISSEFLEEELKNFLQKITNFIEETGGSSKEMTNPVKRLMEKGGEVYLITLNFHLNPEKLNELEKKLKSEGRILRYLILTKKMPRPAKAPKAIKPAPKLPIKAKKPKEKVELKEIEKKLEEILGE